MVSKWSQFMMGSFGFALIVFGAACGSTTVEQGTGGKGGTGGEGGSSSSSSSSGSGGAPVACDPMNLPADGTPCMKEGEFCSPGCEDPCSFCNIKTCTNGVWTNLEVFPAPCLSCEEICVPVVAAQCAGGPPDQAACVQGCNQQLMSNCKILFNQMLACVGTMPTVSCDAMNRPTVPSCTMEFEKLYACIMP